MYQYTACPIRKYAPLLRKRPVVQWISFFGHRKSVHSSSLYYGEKEPTRRDGSKPRDTSHGLLSNIKAQAQSITTVKGTGSEGRLRAQGRITWFAFKHKGPGTEHHNGKGNRPGGTAPGPGTHHMVCFYKGPGHIIPFTLCIVHSSPRLCPAKFVVSRRVPVCPRVPSRVILIRIHIGMGTNRSKEEDAS